MRYRQSRNGGHISVRQKFTWATVIAFVIAFTLIVCIWAGSYKPPPADAAEGPTGSISVPVTVVHCSTVPAVKWNQLLRLNREVTFKKLDRRRIKHRPVCVRPYKTLKRIVYHRVRNCGGGTPNQNRCLGRRMAAKRGWIGAAWGCLDTLWGDRESGWDEDNINSGSGAAGIPQRLPMPQRKIPPSFYGNPPEQIAWGLDYIKGRYDTPCNALAHSYSHNWY